MANKFSDINFPTHYPSELKNILLSREDLLKKGLNDEKNERKLVQWLILHGKKEYKSLFNENQENNELIEWLSKDSSDKKFQNIPRVFLAIWDLKKKLRRRFPDPNNNDNFLNWIEKEFDNFEINIPKYSIFFKKKQDLTFMGYCNHQLSNIAFEIKYIFILIFLSERVLENNLSGNPIAGNLSGFEIQKNVISALVYRELKTRVSQVKFGVVGVFLEPVGVLAVFLIIFSLLRGYRADIDIELFLISGILMYTLFTEIAIRSLNALDANEALFFYKPVKPVDTVIARTIVESCLYGIVFIVLVSFIFLFKEKWILQNFYLLISSYLGLILFSFGLGLNIMIIGFKIPVLKQLFPLFTRPLWFISGIFFSINTVPFNIRPFLSWNPIFQSIELVRHSFSSNYFIPSEVISLTYLWTVGFIITSWGLYIYSRSERFLLTR